MENFMLPCPIKYFFGMECLGCGFQRALFLLFQGEFAQAFYLYPAVYPIIMLGGLAVFHKIFRLPNTHKIIWIIGLFSVASIIISYGFKHFSTFIC